MDKYDSKVHDFFKTYYADYYTNRLFIEYGIVDKKFNIDNCLQNTELYAGIDYFSKERKVDREIIIRHKNLCSLLKIPYFVVYLEGRKLKTRYKLEKFKLLLSYSNCLAKSFVNRFQAIYCCNTLIFDESDWCHFIRLLHNLTGNGNIYSKCFGDVNDTLIGIMSDRHHLYGDTIYLTDIDVILSDKTDVKVIIEFKTDCYRKNDLTPQDCVYYKIASLLKCPCYKIWHDGDMNQFIIYIDYLRTKELDNDVLSVDDLKKMINKLL